MMFASTVLGDTPPASTLDQNRLPYLGKPVYLRLVDTDEKAKRYAAGGFHVSVTRAQGGGCRDGASAIPTGSPSSCSYPLGRSDLTGLWSQAASLYYQAYTTALSQGVAYARNILTNANAAADQAYAAEGVDPPRDPVTQQTDALANHVGKSGWVKGMAIGLGAVLLIGGVSYAVSGHDRY